MASETNPLLLSAARDDGAIGDGLGLIQRYSQKVEVRPGRFIRMLNHNRQQQAQQARTKADALGTVLFVHGSCATMDQFDAQILHFSALGYHVVAFDALGCGESDKPDVFSAYSTEQLFDDLCAMFDRDVAPGSSSGPIFVVGHSFGTSQAMRLAAARPAAIERLVLLGTAAHIAAPKGLFSLPLCILVCLQPLLSRGFLNQALHPHTLRQTTPAHRALVRRCKANSGANKMYMAQAFYRQFEWASPAVIAQVRAPVLIIQGEGDQITPVAGAAALAAKLGRQGGAPPGVRIEVVPRAGHQVMMEDPRRVNGLIERFLQEGVLN